MSAIFTPQTTQQLWLEIELLACEARAELGEIPKAALGRLRTARVDPARVAVLEERLGHEIVAFLAAVSEGLGDEARYLHQGLTSSDILDTTLATQLVRAADLLIQELARLQAALRRRAVEERDTLMVGRTHGIHAEPVTFGFVLAGWLDELDRAQARLKTAREEVRCGKLAGAVGTHATVDPRVEEYVCSRLGLRVVPAATQIVARDRHAAYLAALAVVAGSLEKFATDIRHLMRSEVAEVREPFGEEQKGSSAMPHKRNPVLSERICGLARTMRGYAQVALENQALWHERDISPWSAERIVFPDACAVLHFMLRSMTQLVDGLVVDRERMRANLFRSGGVVFSQRVLLALVEKGLARDEAYRIVQRPALQALDQDTDFRQLLEKTPEVQRLLSRQELSALFDPAYYLRNLPATFARLGLEPAPVEVQRP